jgi:hypothetical protein
MTNIDHEELELIDGGFWPGPGCNPFPWPGPIWDLGTDAIIVCWE